MDLLIERGAILGREANGRCGKPGFVVDCVGNNFSTQWFLLDFRIRVGVGLGQSGDYGRRG